MNQKNIILNELSKLNDSLLNKANEINNSLLNKTNEINNSLLIKTSKINELFKIKSQNYVQIVDKTKVDQNQFKKFIPIKQKWTIKSLKEIFLTATNQTYEIIASSTLGNNDHSVINLFNGEFEPKTHSLCWRNNENDKMPQIKIKFKTPVVANAFLISSRNVYFRESPIFFEIFGVNETSIEKSLGSFIQYNWKSSETLVFPFENENLYPIYIFRMYKSHSSVIGMAEFNLGFLP